jgi:hypothetical protein
MMRCRPLPDQACSDSITARSPSGQSSYVASIHTMEGHPSRAASATTSRTNCANSPGPANLPLAGTFCASGTMHPPRSAPVHNQRAGWRAQTLHFGKVKLAHIRKEPHQLRIAPRGQETLTVHKNMVLVIHHARAPVQSQRTFEGNWHAAESKTTCAFGSLRYSPSTRPRANGSCKTSCTALRVNSTSVAGIRPQRSVAS